MGLRAAEILVYIEVHEFQLTRLNLWRSHAMGGIKCGAIVGCPAPKRSVLKSVREHWGTGLHPAI